ncbi:3-deoxy-7-phosphoheptulonate synthase [Vreelandella boliviensis]|uniref:Phospho-2-dehydro-3-deoxyheptonate aldolase n=1 Tax=Vreelandella boliviensis LC1 TaxID=1072583 RepID=A0A265E2D9_9GAMM|nr:3-deoxy-7-phosphoheptulonate synthase [Halomonas boliviensis]EHJ93759.1 Phospho-2-dehydro-3-deoxyheptonate aldolase, Tyr-sensitive [Halomonas boliviensis LC1]OZT75744.1 3-deoxy-7-phosphoheptulonate synthase [Halomonas boliviensis LC1]
MNAPISPVINKTTVTTAQATSRLTPSAPESNAKRLPTPAELRQRISLSDPLGEQIARQRHAVQQILSGHDERLLVVVGPCSIDDPDAALEYADRLAALSEEISERILPVMRVYVEKPRTTVGWKGLAYDPDLDGSGDMPRGLALSRELMHAVAARGLPVATELLQPMLAAYVDDLLSWVAIGARTTESQLHRELASDLSAAVGFKNATSGDVQVAIDAMSAAAHPHQRFAVDPQGYPIVQQTAGNPHTHVVLRGGHGEPNYQAQHVRAATTALRNAGQNPRLMVDCSHANARKDHRRQSEVMLDVLAQRQAGEANLVALMLESHLFEGKQPLKPGAMRYGVSVTDACVGWETTEHLLKTAADRLA